MVTDTVAVYGAPWRGPGKNVKVIVKMAIVETKLGVHVTKVALLHAVGRASLGCKIHWPCAKNRKPHMSSWTSPGPSPGAMPLNGQLTDGSFGPPAWLVQFATQV